MLLSRRRIGAPRAGICMFAIALSAVLPSVALSSPGGKHRPAHADRYPKPAAKAATRPSKARATLADSSMLFAPDSVWNAPLAPTAALDPDSARLVSGLVAEVANEQHLGWGPWISSTSDSTPIYRVGPDQPTVKVKLDDPTVSWRVSLQAAFEAVPIPDGAQPARGYDGHMTIWQPSTDKLWEFWKARKLSDGWHASWGGAIANVSQSPGYYTTGSWPGAMTSWGATATSLPVAAGTITLDELLQGHIDHALAIDLPHPRSGVFSWPAQRTDGDGGATEIPEGAHLRLDPNLDLSKLTMSPLVRMMAVAAQRYGLIVRDKTGHAIGFFIEDPLPSGRTSVVTDLYGGQYPTQFLARFPWSSLQVLRMKLHGSSG